MTKITLSPDTQAMLDEVDAVKHRVDQLRPFDAEIEHRLSREFLPDRVTATLNLEGIGVTRRQTLAMMDAQTISVNVSKNELELKNALDADARVYDGVRDGEVVTEAFIREVNALILSGNDRVNGGEYRTYSVDITGARFQPPDPMTVPAEMRQFAANARTSRGIHPILHAAWVHATFTHIHPFGDGNGRTGRLLQDFVLMKGDLYPTGIPASQRDRYYDALECADAGEWNDLVQLIARQEVEILRRVEAVVREIRSRGEFITNLAKAAAAKKSGTVFKKYRVWVDQMESFLKLFDESCAALNAQRSAISIRSDSFDIIDFDKWKTITESGRADNTWVRKSDWYADGNRFYRTIMFFSRHEFRPDDIHPNEEVRGTPSLFMTGGDPRINSKFNFQKYRDREIRFRELMFVDGTPFVALASLNSDGVYTSDDIREWREPQSLDEVVKLILVDLFQRKLGL